MTAMFSLGNAGRVAISPLPSLPQLRCACRLQCSSSDPSTSSGDENKAFQMRSSNRRKQPQTRKGTSDSLISSLAELSKGQPQSGVTRTVFSSDQMSWKAVDQAVNEYPGQRVFTAIGLSSVEFTAAMVRIVESELACKVHEEAVVVRPSKKGNYSSVKIGPVTVTSPDQVISIYGKMKADTRLKWFI